MCVRVCICVCVCVRPCVCACVHACVFPLQLTELEKKLKEAQKKGFRAKIAEINQQKETYTREKENAIKEVEDYEARQHELRAKLDKADASLKDLDPSTALPSFEDLCEYSCFVHFYLYSASCEGKPHR